MADARNHREDAVQELRELETDGIVVRTVHQVVPSRVDYALAEQGQWVRPVFAELLGYPIPGASDPQCAG